MDLRHSPAVQPLSSASGSAESRSGRIGPISLGMKQMGERSAGNPHAIVRRGGAWKRGMVEIVGHSQTKERANGEPEHRPKPARQASTLLSGGRRLALQWAPPPTRQSLIELILGRDVATGISFAVHDPPAATIRMSARIGSRTVSGIWTARQPLTVSNDASRGGQAAIADLRWRR